MASGRVGTSTTNTQFIPWLVPSIELLHSGAVIKLRRRSWNSLDRVTRMRRAGNNNGAGALNSDSSSTGSPGRGQLFDYRLQLKAVCSCRGAGLGERVVEYDQDTGQGG